jgi:hypothetical protein
MSMALISLCSFLSGVGSCAAFQAALKTGMRLVNLSVLLVDSFSNSQLANSPWIGDGLSIGCIRVERLLLHSDSWHCISRRHFWVANDALSCDFAPRADLDTLPYRRRPQSWDRICCATNQ